VFLCVLDWECTIKSLNQDDVEMEMDYLNQMDSLFGSAGINQNPYISDDSKNHNDPMNEVKIVNREPSHQQMLPTTLFHIKG
jgi:hypothetical protein